MDKQAAINRLKEILHEGDVLHMFVTNVARSGMSRSINIYFFSADDRGKVDTQWLAYFVANALEMKFDKDRDSVRIGGAGMDMGFAIADHLSRVLFDRAGALTHHWL